MNFTERRITLLKLSKGQCLFHIKITLWNFHIHSSGSLSLLKSNSHTVITTNDQRDVRSPRLKLINGCRRWNQQRWNASLNKSNNRKKSSTKLYKVQWNMPHPVVYAPKHQKTDSPIKCQYVPCVIPSLLERSAFVICLWNASRATNVLSESNPTKSSTMYAFPKI